MSSSRAASLDKPATASEPPSAERLYDWSLRALMAVIVGGLVACAVFLAWRWAQPAAEVSDRVPLSTIQRPAKSAPTAEPAQKDAGQVLLQPGQMYRCEGNGRVTFSDQPCTEGSSRVVALPAAK